MNIPDTPDELYEQLAEQNIRKFFKNFDEMPLIYQKIALLLQTEITKGSLTDLQLRDITCFVLDFWRALNMMFLQSVTEQISTSPTVYEETINKAMHFSRLDQYLGDVISTFASLPRPGESDDLDPNNNTGIYSIRGAGD